MARRIFGTRPHCLASGAPFERTAHLVDVRRIAGGAGRYNIPNIGVHIWRLSASELHRATAHQVDADNRLHYTFSQLGQDVRLFRRPQDMPRAFDSATERNVPDAIRRRVLDEQFGDLYGEQSSVAVWDGEHFIEPEQVAVCDLTGWVHAVSADRTIAIDPVLGRIAFAERACSRSQGSISLWFQRRHWRRDL